MTPDEITKGERFMIALICLPAFLVGLLYLVA
jgi:hypothetical protein